MSDRFNPWRVFDVICVPVGLLAIPDLSAGAKLCLGVLMRYAGRNGCCYPSVRRLMKDLGAKSERTIQSRLNELEASHLILRHQDSGKVNHIEFLDRAPWPRPPQ